MVKMPSLQKKLREIFQECWLDGFGETSTIYKDDLEEKVLAVFHEELGLVAQQIRLDKKRDIGKRWEKFKQKNKSLLKREMKTVEFYAFNIGYELAKKEDLGLLVDSGTLETLKIMEDKKLMKLLTEGRKKGSHSLPYELLVEDSRKGEK